MGPAAADLDDDRRVQPLQHDGVDVQEIDRQDRFGLSAQERAPRVVTPGRRRYPPGSQDLTDSGGGHTISEPAHLALDTNDTPGGVLRGEPDDQRHHIVRDRWAARCLGLAPLRGEQTAMPAQEGAGGDDPVYAQRFRQQPGQRGEYGPVRPVDPRLRVGPAKHRDFVAQREYLDVL